MNRISVIGRLVRDTELRTVGDGRVVMNNTIAIPRAFKSENGQDTDFLNVVAWGKRAELMAEFCHKGDLIGLDGRIQSRTYQKDSDQKVYIVEMNVEGVYFLQSRQKKNGVNRSQSATQPEPTADDTNRRTHDTPSVNQESVPGIGLTIEGLETVNS